MSSEMEIIFTELLLTERMNNMRKSLVQVIVCLRKILRSLSCNFFSRILRRILSGKTIKDHGNSGRNCVHIVGCASLLKRPIFITHRHSRKGSVLRRELTPIRSHSSQQRSSVSDSALKPQYLMIKHAISISCCLKLALLALFCITKPRKTLEIDLTHVQKPERLS